VYLALIALSVLLQEGAKGYLSGRLAAGDSLLFSCLSFFVAAVVCGCAHGLSWRSRRSTPRRTGPQRSAVLRELLLMNVLTAACFLSVFLALTWIPAALTSGVTAALGPLVVACAGLTGAARRPTPATWAFVLALLVVGLALAVRLGGGAGSVPAVRTGYGLLLAALAGVAIGLLTLVSRRLGRLGVGTTEVMAARFHLTYLLAAALIVLRGGLAPGWARAVPGLALLGICAVVLPLFLMQFALQRTDPLAAVVVLATAPAVSYGSQLLFGASFDAVTLLLIALLIAIAAAAALHDRRAGARPVVAPVAVRAAVRQSTGPATRS
jgi:drug/metabolite transporter (DMT)-like permease